MKRSVRRALEGTVAAAVLGGAPSTLRALSRGWRVSVAVDSLEDATRRIGVLVPPFRPGLVQGVVAHAVVSGLAGQAMARLLPERRSVLWAAGGGLLMGWWNVGVIGRRIPAIAELPRGPQVADNIAFGIVFAAVADRGLSATSGESPYR